MVSAAQLDTVRVILSLQIVRGQVALRWQTVCVCGTRLLQVSPERVGHLNAEEDEVQEVVRAWKHDPGISQMGSCPYYGSKVTYLFYTKWKGVRYFEGVFGAVTKVNPRWGSPKTV